MPIVRKNENAVCLTAADGTGLSRSCTVARTFGFGDMSTLRANFVAVDADFGELAFAAVHAETSWIMATANPIPPCPLKMHARYEGPNAALRATTAFWRYEAEADKITADEMRNAKKSLTREKPDETFLNDT